MSFPNSERNKDLVNKRLDNPKKWSYGVLGRYFNIDKTTAEDIFKRDIEKYSTKIKIAKYNILLKRMGELTQV